MDAFDQHVLDTLALPGVAYVQLECHGISNVCLIQLGGSQCSGLALGETRQWMESEQLRNGATTFSIVGYDLGGEIVTVAWEGVL